ncbi:malate:quinone oxidoreductase [Salisediminibacterium beveridgei]|uniref:Probable malate:quinone oxidoreductase n=1 Tax=Salisediminibacterium beveridgei TaxID=632773 RepID=A0A1D7QQZ5_9BACI|nr:malate:quinone oxidoreductase [Salisediminibacterium beveridgei]AOM81444.1 Malate:quinone oxidoreductase [Salisediminibacterium beveridgei]
MTTKQTKTDVVLIGAGVMSATLGSLIKELQPDWDVHVFEKLDSAAQESSNEWNNAGTGHSALCELNYTTELDDGSISIDKAVDVNEQFQVSRQYWSYLVKKERLRHPESFIRPIPHISFVQGEDGVAFLRKRYESLLFNPLFKDMHFSTDHEELNDWFPLMMNGRDKSEAVAATKIDYGTDINFGDLTRQLMSDLETQKSSVQYGQSVDDLYQNPDGTWNVNVRDTVSGRQKTYRARFVFIGAGGGSLHLLQKTGIKEAKRIGGFPVSGLFMVCKNQEVIEQHHAKVYGKAKVGAPPMSVPHLDTRYMNGKKALLFGPYAGFSPKFLKQGSYLDLLTSVNPDNVFTMLAAGAKEMPLTKYLIQQILLNKEQRMKELREFIPDAQSDDWKLVTAGQRVQVIKDTEEGGKGTLQFGTEVVSAADGSVAALLGASPGASTAVSVMLDVLERCFPERMADWEPKIKEMIPSYGKELMAHPDLFDKVFQETADILKLKEESSHQTVSNQK